MSPESKDRITPLLELPPIPWDFGNDAPARSIDTHLKKVAQKIELVWGTSPPLFVDFTWIAETERMSDGKHPIECIFNAARMRGLMTIPVAGLLSSDDHLAACADAINQDSRGLCLRLQREDFVEFAGLDTELARILNAGGVIQEDVDLVLDLRALVSSTPDMHSGIVLGLMSKIPNLDRWRTFTLASPSFPPNLVGLPPSDCSVIPRREWNLWQDVVCKNPARLPTFGDYVISHAEPSEVDARVMRPSASVRYTADGSWLILKERSLRDYGYEQFHEACRTLISRPEYMGRDFSWGDGYIDDCANESVGTGNLTTWRKVGTSHHLAFVLRQLSTAFDS
jgi:hypothetical protein